MSMMLQLPGDQNNLPSVSTRQPNGDLGPIKYGRLKRTNPRLNVERVRILKALYRGGQSLLDDKPILHRVFPKYVYESEGSYQERLARVYYENMFALVINQISAGLAQDPVRFADDMKPDEYWTGIMDNATPLSDDGTSQRSFDQLLRDSTVEGLVTGWSWLQADLPKPEVDKTPDGTPILPTSLAEQEEEGKLRAYLVLWPTEQVTDWDEQKGKLLWVRTYECVVDASDPSMSRDDKLHVWTIWTPTKWFRYEVLEKKIDGYRMPTDTDDIPVKDSGDHSFGRVPWTRFDVASPGGAHLWIGDMIESLCRNYFNRQNGESYQWTQFHYQQLYEFLAPEIAGIDTVVSEAQQDPSRAQRRRAPGVVQVRGHEDKAMFVGPNMSGSNVGREAMMDLRDAILRVTQQMALAQDSNGALLRRSAQSKQQDAKGTEILLTAIGRRVVICANNAACLLGAGRGDGEEAVPQFAGYENFDVSDMSLVLDQAAIAQSINIPSASYQVEMLYQVAIAHLGENVSEELKAKILEELKGQITQDQFAVMPEEGDNPWGEDEDAPPGFDPDAEDEEDEEKKEKKKGNPFE